MCCCITHPQIKSVVLLNAGATADVIALFEAEDSPTNVLRDLKFYIIDSHRPVHLANCFDETRVFVFDDGLTQDTVPHPAEILNSDSEDDDNDNDDNDDDDDDDDDAGGQNDAADDNGGTAPQAKRQKRPKRPKRPKRRPVGDGWIDEAREDRRRERLRMQDQYYGQTFYGPAVATLLWQLADDLHKTSNHLLWLAIVGVTEQFVHEKIDADTYAENAANLADHVGRLNDDSDAPGERAVVNRLHITREPELRFMLLRHWTLFEAMCHSQYVASRLGVWRSKGRDRLKDLLARMGVSLEQCQQKYTNMVGFNVCFGWFVGVFCCFLTHFFLRFLGRPGAAHAAGPDHQVCARVWT
jgi:cell division control protein 45